LIIAVLASYTALDMAGRVSETTGRVARWWLFGGSVAMGVGIWSMHFLGMLAFNLPVPMGYDPTLTFVSMLIAIASSAFGLWNVCRPRLSWGRLSVGAILMGAGVCSMHYTGMAAMRMTPAVHYIPALFFLSVVIAVFASGTALWIAFHLRHRTARIKRLRAGAAIVMGFAIAGMHYTGMAAAEFPKNGVCTMTGSMLSTNWMAPIVVVFSSSVLLIALLVSMFDFRIRTRTEALNSSLDRANEELRFLALHDRLTKLPNRTLLEDRLDHEVANAKRAHKAFSVLLLDLDGFKQVNDAYGHQVGDLLLIEVAQRFCSLLRASDIIARLGGDEFVVVVDSGDPARTANICEKLIAVMQEPFVLNGHVCEATVSIGVALYMGPRCTSRDLLKRADAAMHHAKSLGRNTYCFFDASMNKDAQQQLQLMADLRRAIHRNELVLYFQPKFDANTLSMLGAEALIRWNHPNRGLLQPSQFIPLAEKLGLIIPIGNWTVKEACRQLSEWKTLGHKSWSIAVNLSAVQFKHPKLLDVVKEALEDFQLDPGSLILEITESTAMQDPANSVGILQKLHKMGVRISIDDFGTGYSSLIYLKRLPADELKIDRGFVRELSPGNEDAAIISAIVALAQALNLDIVAEGVETLAQMEFLTELGCSALQGFLFGRPMPSDQLLATITRDGVVSNREDVNHGQTPKLLAQIPASV
jgi:diguanylate cyclase (GGDEF)-like protein